MCIHFSNRMKTSGFVLALLLITVQYAFSGEDEKSAEPAKKKKKKDIRDYSDAEMEELFTQWEVRLQQTTI